MNHSTTRSRRHAADHSTEPLPEQWDRLTYVVRVRGANAIYLWGSAKVTQDMTFPSALLLHVRNDVLGEEVALSTTSIANGVTTLGKLEPGECLSIPLQTVSGVYATCALDTLVSCLIRGA